MNARDVLFLGGVTLASGFLVVGSLLPRTISRIDRDVSLSTNTATSQLDQVFQVAWDSEGVEPSRPADELTRMRRLSLALTGSIPALEEIRRFESRPAGRRLDPWLDELLADRRSSDYLAERLARAYVGTEDGPFLLFRRRRFTTWLSDAILANQPYDQIVDEMIASEGLWTAEPATNFITATYSQDTERPDPEKLAVRVSRCFLGVRLDCAQCHDHPFREWKQRDFRGVAAFFGSLHSNLRGIRDTENDYRPIDPSTDKPGPTIEPAVPFRAELLKPGAAPRARLSSWLADRQNPTLARATVNRFWALLFGRPLSDPVDDLPPDDELPETLIVLAQDFIDHDYDLRRLLRLIANSAPFRLDSATDNPDGPSDLQEAHWASFPLTPLRPEQSAESVIQCGGLSTIGPESAWPARLAAFTGRNDFVRRYGDLGEDEFDAPGGTIPQRLLLMNGDLVGEKINPGLFTASSRIAAQAPNDRAAVEVAYLAILTRRPTDEESAHFAARLHETTGDQRGERVADLFWTLLNSNEFAWNH